MIGKTIPNIAHPWDDFQEKQRKYQAGYNQGKLKKNPLSEKELELCEDNFRKGYEKGLEERKVSLKR